MKRRGTWWMAVAVLALFGAAEAEKISKEFRAQFEMRFPPQRVWGVVVQSGVPTSSIYGTQGNSSYDHYSIDVLSEREWKNSGGLLDVDQVAVDFLDLGEVMELDSIAWKDNRIDMRWVSLESKKVTRGEWPLKTTKPEPVATNFKFFLPYPKTHTLGERDLEDVFRYIDAWIQPFRGEDEARDFAARVRSGGEGPREAPRADRDRDREPRRDRGPAKREIAVGMTPLQVIEILGKPEQELAFQSQQKWTYPDLVVVFENGKVKEVRF